MNGGLCVDELFIVWKNENPVELVLNNLGPKTVYKIRMFLHHFRYQFSSVHHVFNTESWIVVSSYPFNFHFPPYFLVG